MQKVVSRSSALNFRTASAVMIILQLTSYPASAAVYGADKRELVLASSPKVVQELGLSIAAMIHRSQVSQPPKNDKVVLQSTPLGAQDNLCEGERFYSEPSIASCTGFLVGADLLLTAGHCVKDADDCQSNVWLFNLRIDSGPVSANELYQCRKIEDRAVSYEGPSPVDYALIRLDRRVKGRVPLKLSQSFKLAAGSGIFALGYPLGLPLVLSPGGVVWSATPALVTGALDTFHKSSGSPVFNSETNEVEGMLIFGSMDYKLDFGGVLSPKCNRVYTCLPGDNVCFGEGALGSNVLSRVIHHATDQATSPTSAPIP